MVLKVVIKCLILLFLFATAALSGPQPVTIDVQNRVTTLGSQVRITIKVEPDDSNRSLEVEWYVIPDFPNRKFVDVEGTNAKRIYQYYITLREAGETTFRAIVHRNDGSSKVASTSVQVIGGF